MSEEKKQLTLEQAKLYRALCRVAFFLVACIAPILITGFKFKLFTQYTNTKISIMAIMVALIVAWRFKKRIVEWINSWENSNILKHILIGIGRVWPFALIVAILALIHWSAQQMIADALFCLEWTCGCELFSYLVIYPIEMKMDYYVNRLIRKQERKEDYKEAIREMREEEANGTN